MKLNAPQLYKNLQSSPLPPVIWISGDEPLLVLEACDAVRAKARELGITDRQIIDVDARFDGAELIAANQTMSLFGERELIELRMQSKFNDKGRKALLEYVQTANPDNLLLIVSERVEAAQSKAKWFKQVEEVGWWLPLWPIEHHQLPGWIQQRVQQQGLSADAEAVALLAERVDGNLLAAKQEIDKLALLVENQHIRADDILGSVSDNSRYTVFDLSAALLVGDLARSVKIMNGLASEGVEPPIVLWLITRELRLLVELAEAQMQGQIGAAFKKLRVFDKRQQDYQRALQRAPLVHYQKCLIACARIDALVKGQRKGNAWTELSEMLVAMTTPALPVYSLEN
ncbi:MAG: DNA polymerase III subunit delta [Reinekea sp.]